MSSINSNEIISILKEEIENFDMMSKDSEVGTVITVGDGIASIYGIDHDDTDNLQARSGQDIP